MRLMPPCGSLSGQLELRKLAFSVVCAPYCSPSLHCFCLQQNHWVGLIVDHSQVYMFLCLLHCCPVPLQIMMPGLAAGHTPQDMALSTVVPVNESLGSWLQHNSFRTRSFAFHSSSHPPCLSKETIPSHCKYRIVSARPLTRTMMAHSIIRHPQRCQTGGSAVTPAAPHSLYPMKGPHSIS